MNKSHSISTCEEWAEKVGLTALATIHFHCREKSSLDILTNNSFYVLLKKCFRMHEGEYMTTVLHERHLIFNILLKC